MVAGTQVPVIGVTLVELTGKLGATAFKHNGPICVKVGVLFGAVISISIVVVVAHCPASGLNVYVVIPTAVVLIALGVQVPVIAGKFVELSGKVLAVEF